MEQESQYGWTPEEKASWENFRRSLYKRFIPPAYLDQKKHEYYKKFTDLSSYDAETAANPAEMLHRFKLGTKKKWRSMSTILPCATYQEFYDVLLRIEDSYKMPSESEEEEERGSNLKKHDKGKGQSSQGPRQTQSFKKSGTSSSSSSGGFSATRQRRGGRPTGGSRFQRPREVSG